MQIQYRPAIIQDIEIVRQNDDLNRFKQESSISKHLETMRIGA